MNCGETREETLHRIRQCFVCRVHVGEQSVAANGRHLPMVKDGPKRWFSIARNIGMPFLAGNTSRVFISLDNDNLRMPSKDREWGRMDMQASEVSPEGLMLFRRQVLITEKNYEMFQQRPR
jgi:hypothetical protein